MQILGLVLNQNHLVASANELSYEIYSFQSINELLIAWRLAFECHSYVI